MAILSTTDVRNIDGRFEETLSHAPGTKVDKQNYFRRNFNVSVPKTNYELMWARLKEILGRPEAAEAIFQLVIDSSTDRLRTLLIEAYEGQSVTVLQNDLAIVWDLFHGNGNPRTICDYLLEYIEDNNIILSNNMEPPMGVEDSPSGFEFSVALSFAGEQRKYVRKVAESLRNQKIKVFYDEFKKTFLWGKDLVSYLDEVYRKKAQYCVIFISSEYASKAWPRHEARSALARAINEKKEYILPVRFDDTDLPGLPPTVGYVNANQYSPDELAHLIIEKMKEGEGSYQS